DRVISEQNMQRSKLTESQMVRIGKLLNLSCIVIGDVNVVMSEYNVDVRVINVESGVVIATAGKAFTGSYGENMRTLAQTLAGKIAIKPGQTVPATPTPTQPVSRQQEPAILYGYLKVFPNDLGTFDSRPASVIANINKSQQYGYGTWRLPTKEELNLMRANNLIGGDGYMASDGSRSGKVRLVTDKQKGEEIAIPAGYVDLGLHSGTLWKDKNEEGGFYTYDQAMSKFGNELPTKEQCEELVSSCKWAWTGNGYKVTGPSGASITLPAAGYRNGSNVYYVGSIGYYWSSTPDGSDGAYDLYFYSDEYNVRGSRRRTYGRSVRLVAVPQN
ncbi:MAG: hypothetical protein MJZ46_08400, partial [Bacteroidales bacterium]|nr:hypothetical protein [Bacteroidales bacterium]